MTRVKEPFLIAIAALVAVVAGLDAGEKPIEDLGRATQWFLAFANDPYASPAREINSLAPTAAAIALKETFTFPADETPEERALMEHFAKKRVPDVPESLRRFVTTTFDTWKHEGGAGKLDLRMAESVDVQAARVRRDGNTIVLPVAVLGRDVLRATRDDTGLFKNYMWIFSHPRFSTNHPSAFSDDYDLTDQCDVASGVNGSGINPARCGGFAFYAERRDDVLASARGFEIKLEERLRRSFASALTAQP